jgi:hypothetical protein
MYKLKGFMEFTSFLGVDPKTTNAIGEISTLSLTYSRNYSEYVSNDVKDLRLYSFKSATVNADIAIPSVVLEQVFRFVNATVAYQASVSAKATPSDLTTYLNTTYGNEASSFRCGAFVTSGGKQYPSSISWINPSAATSDPAIGAAVQIWLSDANFQSEYDEYEIVIVPPVPNVDALAITYAAAVSALTAYAQSDIFNAIQTARTQNPETILTLRTYDLVDTTRSTNRISVNWNVLIYGQAGNNVDYIRAAIRAYLSKNSTQATSVWEKLIPDLYVTNEYYLIPRWTAIAIASQTVSGGAYSSASYPYKDYNYAKQILNTFPDAFLQTNLESLPTNYNSLYLLAVGSPSNSNVSYRIADLYPDLINVPSSNALFNLMSAKTRGWVSIIETLIILAERATATSPLPSGVSRVVRSNVLYIASEYKGVNYLVATKASTSNVV